MYLIKSEKTKKKGSRCSQEIVIKSNGIRRETTSIIAITIDVVIITTINSTIILRLNAWSTNGLTYAVINTTIIAVYVINATTTLTDTWLNDAKTSRTRWCLSYESDDVSTRRCWCLVISTTTGISYDGRRTTINDALVIVGCLIISYGSWTSCTRLVYDESSCRNCRWSTSRWRYRPDLKWYSTRSTATPHKPELLIWPQREPE